MLISAIKVVVVIFCVTLLGVAFWKGVEAAGDRQAALHQEKEDFKNAWFRECVAEKKLYECNALWVSSYGRKPDR